MHTNLKPVNFLPSSVKTTEIIIGEIKATSLNFFKISLNERSSNV